MAATEAHVHLVFINVKKVHVDGKFGPDEVAFVHLPGRPSGKCCLKP